MKIESEKVLEKRLNKKVEDLGGWSIKMVCTFISGLPDRLCLLPGGRVLFVEVKTTGEKPSKVQKYVHKKLRALGFQVEVVDSSAQIDWIL